MYLHIRKTMRTVKYWNKASRDVAQPSSLEIFKTQLYMVLHNLFYLTLLSAEAWS